MAVICFIHIYVSIQCFIQHVSSTLEGRHGSFLTNGELYHCIPQHEILCNKNFFYNTFEVLEANTWQTFWDDMQTYVGGMVNNNEKDGMGHFWPILNVVQLTLKQLLCGIITQMFHQGKFFSILLGSYCAVLVSYGVITTKLSLLVGCVTGEVFRQIVVAHMGLKLL